MAEFERSVINHYNIAAAYPTQWPPELDEESDDDHSGNLAGIRRSGSRYSALERSASERRSIIPGSQRTGDGRANLVQKDESDPLGGINSVILSLKQRGLPIEQDTRLRNKFLLSSTTFSPALFLSQTHPNASTEELVRGLEYLSKSIDQKSASLKVLVETNFERFVRAKATIDNVYTEMRNQGVDPDSHLSPRHSRQVSRSSGHYRNFSGGSVAGMNSPSHSVHSKNALRKETEYGVQGIKGPLLEVSQRAQDVWGPAINGREREASLKSVIEAVERDKALYELGADLGRSIKRKDYDKAIQQYNLARTYSNHAKVLGERAIQGQAALTDEEIHRILVTGRMWADVEEQVKNLKRDVWRRLSNTHSILPLPGVTQTEEHMELIGVLLELGVDDNPIWVWLLSRYDSMKNKIAAVTERSKIEIEIQRRRLAATEKPDPRLAGSYLRHAVKENSDILDSDHVLEFWETIVTYITKLLSISSGLLGEVAEFWDSAKSFIDGHKQKSLPTGFEGQSRKHHKLSDSDVRNLSNGTVELVSLIQEAVFSLFADPPTDDISSLLSPVSANTPKTPMSAVFSPTNGQLGKIDPKNVPPPSPKVGEPWEGFAFWPPYSNSLSAVHYLGKILVLVGTAAEEMAALGPVTHGSTTSDKIKAMVSSTRERCTQAVCETWSKDAENCKNLEDWTRSPDRRDQTRMPTYFTAFEKGVLNGLQHVLYFPNAITKHESRNIVTPPPSKLIQIVKTQFVSSIYRTLSGMLEIAENPGKTDGDEWVSVTSGVANTTLDSNLGGRPITSDAIDASSRNVRLLLTLSNLKAMRVNEVPHLTSLFESSFSVKLTEETKTIRDVFGQIDHKLFQLYTRPTVTGLTKSIKEGINSPSWAPSTSRPDQVSPYVYAALMMLVMIHTEVSTTLSSPDNTNSALLIQTLSHLLEHVTQALLEGFKERKGTYSLPALMQATLDTEFVLQTMSQYANPKVTESQSQIYMELDKRTNNESRTRLQQELGDMRIVLKKLREGSRGSFGCFKRQRVAEKDRGRPERKMTG